MRTSVVVEKGIEVLPATPITDDPVEEGAEVLPAMPVTPEDW